jgi:hypothetical protein
MKNPCWQCEHRETKCHVSCREYKQFEQCCERLRKQREEYGKLWTMSRDLFNNLRRKELAR